MRSLFSTITLIALLSLTAPVYAKQAVGLVEPVRIDPSGLVVDAKLDTGADNSSIHASHVVRFKRRGESWVRFQVVNSEGKSETLERELVRIAKIKRPTGKSQKRPVVMLGVCLGNTYREVQVTLVDRSQFRYRMIIGRSFLVDDFLVDPSKKYTVRPVCPRRSGDLRQEVSRRLEPIPVVLDALKRTER
jgi:hypothetical protein